MFNLLGDSIIPEILSEKRACEITRISAWSCGTAFGQEAYSMAVLFCEALGHNLNDFDIKILATDIDTNALEKAPWASYDGKAMHKMRPHLLFKYFSRVGDRYVVNDRARSLVTFKYHNVISGSLNMNMDLVLCRNLLIYFQKELQVRVLQNIYTTLNSGGFLILGKTETMAPQVAKHFQVVDLRERIYKKK